MAEYRLLYFPIKGRAEPMRLMFAYAGVKFEDIRWDMQNEWPKHKNGNIFTVRYEPNDNISNFI